MKRIACLLIIALLGSGAGQTLRAQEAGQAQPARSLEELLRLVEQGRTRDAQLQRQRLEEFRAEVERQDEILAQRRARLAELEAMSARLEDRFQAREQEIARLEEQLNQRLGSLKEMFGVLQQVAGDTRSVFNASVISSQYPGREAFLAELIEKAGSSAKLPSIEEIEHLWFEIQREATVAGTVQRYVAPVTTVSGEVADREVVRVGAFNVISGEEYLHFVPETGRLGELARQPADRHLDAAGEFFAAQGEGFAPFWIDPSRGSLLSLLIQTPSLAERIEQGGTIGYLIIALGVVALLLTLERLLVLHSVDSRIRRQIKDATPRDDNPLGRIMATYQKYRTTDKETLELRLGEAIVQETPRISRFLPVLKIIAVVAPLLGLLGTVTGMINTFQAITLFGAGDPQVMAGGISQALVTTVLGLCVAVPTVLLHTLVNTRSRRIVQTLEERAVGIVAQHAEEQNRGRGTA